MHRNKITLLILIILLSCILSVINKPIQAGAQEVITLWHAVPSQYSSLFESISSEEAHKWHGLTKIEYKRFNNMEELHNALIDGSEKPDIALIDTRWQRAIAKKNNIIPIQDLITKKIGRSVMVVLKLDTFKTMWQSCKINGKLVTLPFAGFNRALVINEKVFTENSIKKRPAKWNDLIVIGKLLKAKQDGVDDDWAFEIPINESPEKIASFFQVFMWQAGKNLIEPFQNGELSAFNSGEGKAILKMFVSMIQKYKFCPTSNVEVDDMGMFIASPEEYLELTKNGKKLKVVRWPGKAGSVNDLVVYSFMVFNNGASERKMDKILSMLYKSVEFASALKWSLKTPYLPPNKQVTLSPNYFHFKKEYPGMKVFIAQLKNSKVGIRDPKRIKVMKILGRHIQSALKGETTAEDALEKASKEANEVLDPSGLLLEKKARMDETNKLVDKVWDKVVQ